jgi:aminopeptidase N
MKALCHKLVILFLCSGIYVSAQIKTYTHADTLKGSIGKARAWWDITHYDLHVSFNYPDSSIKGYNVMSYKVLESYNTMQLDLMQPMQVDSIFQDGKKCAWKQDGDAFFVSLIAAQIINEKKELKLFFHGKPRTAKLPPWDGGLVWKKDPKGNPWISIACQGMAAGVWFPNKDHQYDEPDSVSAYYTVPNDLVVVSNGRLRSVKEMADGTVTYNWAVKNPINNYNIIPYIGKYVNFKDTLNGKGGVLDLDFWVLEDNLEKAKKQFVQVKPMLRCFEEWFGKYPFYEDGYKLVEAPYLGMEHQSAIAYGNQFVNGYLGRDLSLTGWGLKWDFIIVHESGHEWFGNNITVKDVADNWVHESFTTYSENLYTEYLFGKSAGADYVIGTRSAVENNEPVTGVYNVNRDGSIDMYYKGANMLHTIRQLVNNDSLWKEMLHGLNKTFWHQTVTGKQVEEYMIGFLKLDLGKIFEQYLTTVKIPEFEFKITNNQLSFRWTNCVKGFNMPLKIKSVSGERVLFPTEKSQSIVFKDPDLVADRNYFITTKRIK